MATKYISPTGNNASAGSIGAPWQTLAYALAHTSSGDTIVFLDGLYTMSSETVANRELAAENPLAAILDHGSTEKVWTVSQTVEIEGLKFINAVQVANAIIKQSGAGLVLNVSRCRFEDCLIASDNTGNYSGMVGWNNAAAVRVEDTVFDNCGRVSGSGQGVCLGGIYPAGTIILEIYNCIFYTNLAAPTAPTRFVTYYLGSPVAGVQLYCKNTSFVNEGPTSVSAFATYQIERDTDHNCFRDVDTHDLDGFDLATEPGCITSDPKFVSAATGNFYPRQDSPLLSAGVNL